MLAEKRIDIPLYSHGKVKDKAEVKKENEQNVKNRAREVRFQAEINTCVWFSLCTRLGADATHHRMKAEDQAWAKVVQFYNSHHTSVVAELDAKKLHKGKAKADSDDVDDRILAPAFKERSGVQLARAVLAGEVGNRQQLAERIRDLPFRVSSPLICIVARSLTVMFRYRSIACTPTLALHAYTPTLPNRIWMLASLPSLSRLTPLPPR
jgi:kinetochore protein Mis13/DSN1